LGTVTQIDGVGINIEIIQPVRNIIARFGSIDGIIHNVWFFFTKGFQGGTILIIVVLQHFRSTPIATGIMLSDQRTPFGVGPQIFECFAVEIVRKLNTAQEKDFNVVTGRDDLGFFIGDGRGEPKQITVALSVVSVTSSSAMTGQGLLFCKARLHTRSEEGGRCIFFFFCLDWNLVITFARVNLLKVL
jgi:hypothetical protein